MKPSTIALTTAAAVGAALLLPTTSSANHIDFFTEGAQTLVLLPPGPSSSSNVSEEDSGSDSIIGGDRFGQIEFAPGAALGTGLGAQINVTDGVFSYSNDPATMGTLTLRYGDTSTLDLVNGPPGGYQLLGIDVEDLGQSGLIGDSFLLNITALDTGSNSDTQSILINSEIQYFVPYAAFAGVDFTSIDSLTYEFVSQNLGADIQIDNLTREVPEPASFALLGLTGAALLLRRRRA